MSWNFMYLSNLRTIDNRIDLVVGCMESFYLLAFGLMVFFIFRLFTFEWWKDSRALSSYRNRAIVWFVSFFCFTSSNTIGLTNELLCFVYAYWPLYWTQHNQISFKWKMTSKSSSIRWEGNEMPIDWYWVTRFLISSLTFQFAGFNRFLYLPPEAVHRFRTQEALDNTIWWLNAQ